MIRYIIIPLASITTAIVNLSLNSSVNSTRVNTTNDKCVIKFDSTSDLIKKTFMDYTWYSHSEILDILNSEAEWINE